MSSHLRNSMVLNFAWVAALFMSCTEIQPAQTSPSTVVSITDLNSVAGKWEGTLTPESRSSSSLRNADWVEVIIRPLDATQGTIEYASYRTIGALMGKGALMLDNGRLTSHGEKGSATYTLYETNGKSELRVDATTKKGLRFEAKLTRSESAAGHQPKQKEVR